MAEKEYIDKETVLKHFDEVMNNEFCDADFKKAALGFSIYVSGLAAADVEPVRHGRWIETAHKGYKCSLCNCLSSLFDENLKSEFCPWCGAKMGGEGE